MNENKKGKKLTEKQHFVPQFYLRNFTNAENELHIYDAKNRRVMRNKGPGGVCHDKFFYAIETGTPDELSQEIEDFFAANIEDPLSKEIPHIITKIEAGAQITEEDKYILATFANHLWLRSPTMRRQINRMEEQVIKLVNKHEYADPDINSKLRETAAKEGMELTDEELEEIKTMITEEEYDVQFSNHAHLRFMLDAENMQGFTNLFNGQFWTIHISKCDRQFVTSDNPITVVLPERTDFYGPSFLERSHFFVLTPTIAIEATYPHNTSGKKIKRKTHFKGDEGSVDTINLHVAGHAEYLYASRPDEIEWFNEYAKNINTTREDILQKMVRLGFRP